MKPGKTTLTEGRKGFLPVVEVGRDDSAVRVSFGTMQFVLSSHEAGLVILRAEAYDVNGHSVPVESHGASDVRNQFEFRVNLPAPQLEADQD